MGEIGTTEELRLESLESGDGERRLFPSVEVGVDVGVGVGVGEGGVRAKSIDKGLKGSLERKGGCRTFRNMLKFLNARFACGTYLEEAQAIGVEPKYASNRDSLVRICNFL